MPALIAFYCPSVLCYGRLNTKGNAAPSDVSYGVESKSVGLRLAEDFHRIEIRYPTAVANPYLVYAATVAAGMDGLKNKSEQQNKQNKSEHSAKTELDNREIDEHEIKLPTSLKEALVNLQKNQTLVKFFGEKFIDHFVSMKMEEIEEAESMSEQELIELYRKCV